MEKTYGVFEYYGYEPTQDEIVRDLGERMKQKVAKLVKDGRATVHHMNEGTDDECWIAVIKFFA